MTSSFGARIGATLLLSLVLACGDDDDDDDTTTPGTDSGTTPDEDAGMGVDSGTTPPTRPEDVPAVRLAGDIATDCTGSFTTSAPVDGNNTGFMAAGQSRSFQLILPPASETGPRPLFIAFNGTGESGPSFSRRAGLDDFAARGFIVVAPSSNMNGSVWPIWDDMRQADDHERPNPDVEYVDALVKCLAGHFEIDRNRIYAAGHSAGGIFTNAFAQRRSQMLAGVIAASGIIDLTTPPGNGDLDPMFAIVTWGGSNDAYSGGVGVTVPRINFVEQAALTSQFYEDEPNVEQVNCHPPMGIGHAWLPINDWFVDRLLEHPKGLPGLGETMVPQPSGFTCSAEPYEYVSTVSVECRESTVRPGCTRACQHIGDCVVENGTVANVVGPQLMMAGFGGSDLSDCDGCVEKCEMDSSMVDDSVFACMDDAIEMRMCGSGISGVGPWIGSINTCCEGRMDSPYCVEICRIMRTNMLTESFLTVCGTI